MVINPWEINKYVTCNATYIVPVASETEAQVMK